MSNLPIMPAGAHVRRSMTMSINGGRSGSQVRQVHTLKRMICTSLVLPCLLLGGCLGGQGCSNLVCVLGLGLVPFLGIGGSQYCRKETCRKQDGEKVYFHGVEVISWL